MMALSTIKLRQNDTRPYLDFTLTTDGVTPHDLTGASAKFTLAKKSDGTLKIDEKTMTIVNAILGKVRYSLAANDLNTIGDYFAEIEVTFADGRILSFPRNEYIPILIQKELS